MVEGPKCAGRELTRERPVDALEGLRNWDAGGIMRPVSFSPTDHRAQPAGIVCTLEGRRFRPLSGWNAP